METKYGTAIVARSCRKHQRARRLAARSFEALVPIQHVEQVTKKVCARHGDYCRSIGATGIDRLLDFSDVRAIPRPTDEGLHFRIDAQDTITFFGIRTLLLGSLCAVAKFSGGQVEWHPAGSVPFGAMSGCLGGAGPPWTFAGTLQSLNMVVQLFFSHGFAVLAKRPFPHSPIFGPRRYPRHHQTFLRQIVEIRNLLQNHDISASR